MLTAASVQSDAQNRVRKWHVLTDKRRDARVISVSRFVTLPRYGRKPLLRVFSRSSAPLCCWSGAFFLSRSWSPFYALYSADSLILGTGGVAARLKTAPLARSFAPRANRGKRARRAPSKRKILHKKIVDITWISAARDSCHYTLTSLSANRAAMPR